MGTTLSSSSFVCLKCLDQYYNNEGFPSKCVKWTKYPIFNCLNYNIVEDKCDKCMENFYLSFDQSSCIKNPDGI